MPIGEPTDTTRITSTLATGGTVAHSQLFREATPRGLSFLSPALRFAFMTLCHRICLLMQIGKRSMPILFSLELGTNFRTNVGVL